MSITYSDFSVVKSSPTALLNGLTAELSDTERWAFFNLSYVSDKDIVPPDELALAIFSTNAISAGQDGVGIFPQTARLNHGCSSAFNAVYHWRDNEKRLGECGQNLVWYMR